MGDDESFSQSNNIPDEIEENKINNYQNIFKIEENLVNESEKEEESSDFLQKKRKKSKIFIIKKESESIDEIDLNEYNYINTWITQAKKLYLKEINEKIKLYPSLENLKLHTPSYEEFTEKQNTKENRTKFLDLSMENILQKKKIKKRENSKNKQLDNSDIIKLIKKTKDKELISLLNINFKEVIKRFYNSFDCILFKFNKDIIRKERMFMEKNKHKNFESLFKKYGLIKYFEEK